MSFPENPLSKYRSYSYHHILIACDSTTVADALSESNFTTDFTQRKNNNRYGVIDKTLSNNASIGKYVILINGLTDAELFIDEIEWETITFPSSSVSDTTRMFAQGKIDIVEPMSARFFKILIQAQADLGTDPSTTVYLLKTIFVGYEDTTTTDSQSTSYYTNVRPFAFSMMDITADYSEAGSKYTIEFVSLANGFASSSQLDQAARNVPNFAANDGTNLSKIIEHYNKVIQDTYDKHYEEVTQMLKDNPNITTKPRAIKYNIILDDYYKDPKFIANGNTTLTNDDGTADGNAKFAFKLETSSMSIQNQLYAMLETVEEIRKDADPQKSEDKSSTVNNRETVIPKILTMTEILPPTQGESGTGMNITYKIVPYTIAKTPFVNIFDGNVEDPEFEQNNTVLKLDYFFTGKNIDILELKMKFENAMTFLHTLSHAGNVVASPTGRQQGNNGNVSTVSEDMTTRTSSMIVAPKMVVTNPAANHSTDPIGVARYNQILSRHAGIETVESTVKINGNPEILNDMSITTKQLGDATTGTSAAKKWQRSPLYVHINVKMPNPDFDATGQDPNRQSYSERFWYNGYYYVFSVKHVFSQGEFTQQLNMFALPVEDPFMTSSEPDATTGSHTPEVPS